MSLLIANQPVGRDTRPFIIAEMSGNHNHSLERALAIVDAAADAGAHAIKLQTYTADTITLDIGKGEFVITDDKSPWKGRKLYDLYNEAHTPWEWHAPIMQRAQTLGMVCFSSPFDESAVEFLQSLEMPAYKIASFENNHLPLIRKVAATGKPMIISSGMATVAELDEAVQTARMAGCRDLVLLKCTSTYPASPLNTNVCTIPHMRALFDCEVGLSDHTMGIGAAVAAVALGATVIEKHFTLRRADGGVDSAFSLEPAELKTLVLETERAWQALGTVAYGPTDAERASLALRRSLYVAENIRSGEPFTARNLRIVRPGNGLHPRFYEQLLGKCVVRDVAKGTAVDWSLVT
ncbi:MAG TPA: pseudaminic acid synthase [Steroidobacteraceae bacterium]|nr:pseudaminic acid synthase [Steroidobacteraceae bacterium]